MPSLFFGHVYNAGLCALDVLTTSLLAAVGLHHDWRLDFVMFYVFLLLLLVMRVAYEFLSYTFFFDDRSFDGHFSLMPSHRCHLQDCMQP